MNLKSKFFIMGLILFLLLNVSFVAASENSTDLPSCNDDSGIALGDNELTVNDVVLENNVLSVANDSDDSKLEGTSSVTTRIIIDSITVDEGQKIEIIAHVKSNAPTTAPGNVVFNFGNKYAKALDSSGCAKITLKGTLEPGIYRWSASYDGGSKTVGSTTYKFSKSSTNFNVIVKGNALLSSTGLVTFYNSGEKFYVNVTNTYTNKGLSNKKLIIEYFSHTANHTGSYEGYTDENGIYGQVFENAPGSYDVTVRLEDDSYNSESISFQIYVKKPSSELISTSIIGNANSYTALKVLVRDSNGNRINEGSVKFTIMGKSFIVRVIGGVATKSIKLGAGNYICDAKFYGDNFYSDETSFEIRVNQVASKITANYWISTTKSYATLKAFVKDISGHNVNEGFVKFIIGGKTYLVKVNNGKAIKYVKLTKAKNYIYRALFSSKNYKMSYAFSTIFVKEAKSYYTFKVGKYSSKINYVQYLKLINAKNNGKTLSIRVKTGLYHSYKTPVYKTVAVKKTKWVYRNVLTGESIYSSDYSDFTSYSYSDSYYWDHGWKWYGSFYKSNSGHTHTKYYSKFKKLITYTEYKKVKVGYRSAYTPVYMYVDTLHKNSLVPKGDYIIFWANDPTRDMGAHLGFKKINLAIY